MKRILLHILFYSLILTHCSTQEIATVDDTNRFPVLAYNSEIIETLTLNRENIEIDTSREFTYWSQ